MTTTATRWQFPRTMTRGVFAGRTFQTSSDYMNALRKARKGNSSNGRAPMEVKQIIELYESLLNEGIGQKRAISILEQIAT